MDLIKICKSVWLKVNCFPERVGVYDTSDTRNRNHSEKGHSCNEHTGPERVYQQMEHGDGWTTRTFDFIPKIF